jgi:hypothetical protein
MYKCSPPKTINQWDLPFESPANIERRLYEEHYGIAYNPWWPGAADFSRIAVDRPAMTLIDPDRPVVSVGFNAG